MNIFFYNILTFFKPTSTKHERGSFKLTPLHSMNLLWHSTCIIFNLTLTHLYFPKQKFTHHHHHTQICRNMIQVIHPRHSLSFLVCSCSSAARKRGVRPKWIETQQLQFVRPDSTAAEGWFVFSWPLHPTIIYSLRLVRRQASNPHHVVTCSHSPSSCHNYSP